MGTLTDLSVEGLRERADFEEAFQIAETEAMIGTLAKQLRWAAARLALAEKLAEALNLLLATSNGPRSNGLMELFPTESEYGCARAALASWRLAQ